MLAYLAGPLDGLDYDGRAWYDEVAHLSPPGWVLFKPGNAYAFPGSDPVALDKANRAVISEAMAVMIAYLDGPGRGFGTIREIEFAKHIGRPVVVIASKLPSLLTYDLDVVSSVDEVWPHITEAIDRMVQAQRDNPIFRLLGGEDPS